MNGGGGGGWNELLWVWNGWVGGEIEGEEEEAAVRMSYRMQGVGG